MDNLLSRMVQAIAQYLRKPWYEQAPADDAVATSNVLIAQLFGGMLGVQRGREVRVNGNLRPYSNRVQDEDEMLAALREEMNRSAAASDFDAPHPAPSSTPCYKFNRVTQGDYGETAFFETSKLMAEFGTTRTGKRCRQFFGNRAAYRTWARKTGARN